MSTINAVSIVCNVNKGEIVTTVDHEPETSPCGEVKDHRQDGKVTISQRVFPAYARCPMGTATRLYREAMAACPGVPVSLTFA